jgi:hypothetical protein
MCHVCEEALIGLDIIDYAKRHLVLAESYGDQAMEAIRSGDDRLANMAARQASRSAMAAEHFTTEYRRRYRESYGHDPE